MIKVLLRLVAVLFVAIGLFLIYAVIHAIGSAGGAKVGVCVAYVAGALILGYLAMRLWRRSAGHRHATA